MLVLNGMRGVGWSGDELLPDELNFVRVQMTKRYKKELEKDQSATWRVKKQ